MPREPWIKLKIGIRRSGKMAGLPTDTARLGWIYVLVEAKVQRSLGVFDNKAHFVEVLGRFGKHFDAYRAAGLLHVAPDLCADCKARHRDAKKGQVVVHDYRREQRDPTVADRVAAHRERHADDDEEPEPNDDVTADVTETERRSNAESNGLSVPTVTADSRARATTATGTTRESLPEEIRSSLVVRDPLEREDVQALLDRGWKRVTKAQRRVLDEVSERHDATGHGFAAEVIRATGEDADPLAAVMTADKAWQDAMRRRLDAEEEAWASTKAQEKADLAARHNGLRTVMTDAAEDAPSTIEADLVDVWQ